MARWWCALWVPERGPDNSVAPAAEMFPDGVQGWWIRAARYLRALEVVDDHVLVNVERTERLIHAVIDAPTAHAAKLLLEDCWLPAQIASIESRRPDWWPRAGVYPISGRNPDRWKLKKAVAGG